MQPEFITFKLLIKGKKERKVGENTNNLSWSGRKHIIQTASRKYKKTYNSNTQKHKMMTKFYWMHIRGYP